MFIRYVFYIGADRIRISEPVGERLKDAANSAGVAAMFDPHADAQSSTMMGPERYR